MFFHPLAIALFAFVFSDLRGGQRCQSLARWHPPPQLIGEVFEEDQWLCSPACGSDVRH
jgi:hypothetical protein